MKRLRFLIPMILSIGLSSCSFSLFPSHYSSGDISAEDSSSFPASPSSIESSVPSMEGGTPVDPSTHGALLEEWFPTDLSNEELFDECFMEGESKGSPSTSDEAPFKTIYQITAVSKSNQYARTLATLWPGDSASSETWYKNEEVVFEQDEEMYYYSGTRELVGGSEESQAYAIRVTDRWTTYYERIRDMVMQGYYFVSGLIELRSEAGSLESSEIQQKDGDYSVKLNGRFTLDGGQAEWIHTEFFIHEGAMVYAKYQKESPVDFRNSEGVLRFRFGTPEDRPIPDLSTVGTIS